MQVSHTSVGSTGMCGRPWEMKGNRSCARDSHEQQAEQSQPRAVRTHGQGLRHAALSAAEPPAQLPGPFPGCGEA